MLHGMTTFASDGQIVEPAEHEPGDVPPATEPQPSPPPDVEPEPEVLDPEPEVLEAGDVADAEDDQDDDSLPAVRAHSDVAVDAPWQHVSEWQYDWLEFKGDKLAIRIPKGSALQALSNSRHCSAEFQDQLVHMFVSKHISDETYERITYRMVDPDDESFTMSAWGELLNAIAELGAERAKAEAEALAAVTSGNEKKGKRR